MSPDAQDVYHNLMDELVSGIKSPPGAVYAPEPGRRCITFFRMAGPTQEQIRAGWSLIEMLRAHGWPAYEVFAHTPPGRVTYQDDHQIVVAVRAKRPLSERSGWNGDRTTIRGRGLAGLRTSARGPPGRWPRMLDRSPAGLEARGICGALGWLSGVL